MRLGILDTGLPQWTIHVAPRVEDLGFSRYWLGEHHGDPGQSGSPEVLTVAVAALTRRIRVGPAGILLRYYSPYKVAQSARLLEALFHPRIDLGVARGAGGDEKVAAKLLEDRPSTTEHYEAKVRALAHLLSGNVASPDAAGSTTFGCTGPFKELWVLGATHRSASLAASLGAAFGFSEYFAKMLAPDVDGAAIVHTYRSSFRPSPALGEPRWNVAVAGAGRTSRRIGTATMAGEPPLVAGVRAWRARLRELGERYETEEVIVLDVCLRLEDRLRSVEIIADAAELAVPA
jgi:luciferase family oxidoreductase group 1